MTHFGTTTLKPAAQLGAESAHTASVAKPAATLATDPSPRQPAKPVASVPRQKPSGDPPDGKLSGPEQRILDSLAWFEAVGVDHPEPPAIAFMAGYTLNGSFFNARAQLKNRGFVEYGSGGMFSLTADGRKFAASPTIDLTNAALHEAVLNRLGGPEQKVLRVLLKHYPQPVANDELAAAAGYTLNGSFFNARGKLRTLGLVSYVGGLTVANALLFPEGN